MITSIFFPESGDEGPLGRLVVEDSLFRYGWCPPLGSSCFAKGVAAVIW